MSKLIDLGLGNRIDFKSKRLVLSWLIDQQFLPLEVGMHSFIPVLLQLHILCIYVTN